MNYQELLKKVSEHVVQFYLENNDKRLFYHNLAHTVQIIDSVNKINSHYKSDEKTNFITCTAGWFHDTGIIATGLEFHEIKSAELAETFLKNHGVNEEEITEIKNCILATQMPQQPNSMAEKIICDADLFNLGTDSFFENNKLVRKEIEAFSVSKISGNEWRERTIALLENHTYHTEFCQSLLNKIKQENLKKIKAKYDLKSWRGHHGNSHLLSGTESMSENDKNLRLKNIKHHLRGVETMFRNSSSNHQHLSVMADNKAFIMISVNSIIISVAIGLIIGKFVLNPKLIIPTILLLSVNVITIIYSVLATRPAIMKGRFTKEQVEKKTVNLLFFGSFYKMPFHDFEYGMRQMMDDSEFLYRSIIKDIYWQGKVLGRKFRLLRISYDIFMYGTALSVIAFLLSSLF
jgi:predicted metal-dependent HD superfamily phosphohydrolase